MGADEKFAYTLDEIHLNFGISLSLGALSIALGIWMMKRHAILVLCHDDPAHLNLLIDSLSGPNSHFFVHVDLKSDIEEFKSLRKRTNVTLVADRVKVHWGGWSQVQATLNSIAAALQSGPRFDYYSLLSGSHFPLRSAAEVFRYFDEGGLEYINLTDVQGSATDKMLLRRFTRFYFEGAQRPSNRRMKFLNSVHRLISRFSIRRPDRSLFGWKLYWGSQWWTLSHAAIEFLVTTLRERPNVATFFRYVHCPDESFFHTILGNSGFLGQCRRSPVYTDWSNPKEAPCFIRMEHLNEILDPNFQMIGAFGGSPAVFARKFGTRNRDVVKRIAELQAGV